MGWKSTIATNASNQELEELLELVGYGDNTNLSMYGHNFTVLDIQNDVDAWYES